MKRILLIVLCSFYFVLIPNQLFSQEDDVYENFKKYRHSNDSLNLALFLQIKRDSGQLEKYKFDILLQKYFQRSLVHREKSFKWSLLTAKIIFWMVIIIVFVGMVFSAIQFYISLLKIKHQINKKGEKKIKETEISNTTKLKISLSGLEVNSSVLGVIILIISLAFFYLYIVHVFHIKEYDIENKVIPKKPDTEITK